MAPLVIPVVIVLVMARYAAGPGSARRRRRHARRPPGLRVSDRRRGRAFRADTGVISPGGIGFDITCGMRLLRTALAGVEVRPRMREPVEALFAAVPSDVGAKGFVR